MSDKPWVIEAGGRRWLVREAVSEQAAMDAITSARVSGSVGHKDIVLSVGGHKQVLADVVQINSDDTERQPYTEPY